MFTTIKYILGSALFGLFIAAVFIGVTRVPQVVYSQATVEYNNGYPKIEIWDVVGIVSPDGDTVPPSEWTEVLKGRFHAIPSER